MDLSAIIISVKDIAELCNGSTADSDSVCEGSNPSSAATKAHIVELKSHVVLFYFLVTAETSGLTLIATHCEYIISPFVGIFKLFWQLCNTLLL